MGRVERDKALLWKGSKGFLGKPRPTFSGVVWGSDSPGLGEHLVVIAGSRVWTRLALDFNQIKS